jgi:hypothetical protein
VHGERTTQRHECADQPTPDRVWHDRPTIVESDRTRQRHCEPCSGPAILRYQSLLHEADQLAESRRNAFRIEPARFGRSHARARSATSVAWKLYTGHISKNELLDNPFVRVTIDYVARVVRLHRTERAFTTLDEIEQTITALAAALPSHRRDGFGVLIDMRVAPERVTPALEPAFDRFRAETERGFARAAVVVTSTLGRARSTRLQRTARVPILIADSLTEALEFLRTGAG